MGKDEEYTENLEIRAASQTPGTGRFKMGCLLPHLTRCPK